MCHKSPYTIIAKDGKAISNVDVQDFDENRLIDYKDTRYAAVAYDAIIDCWTELTNNYNAQSKINVENYLASLKWVNEKKSLEELYNEYLKNPKCIHARQAFLVKKAGQKELCLQARNYIYDKSYLPSYLNEPVGCGGVLYPPASLHKNVLNAEQFMKEVPTHDDLWFWGHAVRNGTPISVIPNGYKLKNIVIEGSQSDSLWHKNMVNSTENVGMTGKEALNKICTLFPEISCRLGLFKK